MSGPVVMSVFAYGVAINLLAYTAMVLDKGRAARQARRIPEATLLRLALLGGSLGTVLAQRRIRHKTRKEPFRSRLVRIVALQVLGALGLCAALLLGWLSGRP